MKIADHLTRNYLATPLNSLSDKDSITSIAISGDNKLLAAAMLPYGPNIDIRNIEGGNIVKTLTGNHQDVVSMAFSLDNRMLVTSHGASGGVRLWDVESGKLIKELLNGMYFNSVAITSEFIFASKRNTNIWIWDLKSMQLVKAGDDDAGNDKVNSFSANGKIFVTAKGRKKPQIINPMTGKKIGELAKHDENIVHISTDNSGYIIVTLSQDSIARVWSVSERDCIADLGDKFNTYENSASSCISNDHRWLAIGRHDGLLQVWDVVNNKKLIEDKIGIHPIMSLAFTSDSQSIIIGTKSGHLIRLKV